MCPPFPFLSPSHTRSFDRSIEVRRPDYQGRLEGIKVHLREKPIAADIDYAELATLTGGMSGAQLAGGPGGCSGPRLLGL